MSVGLLGGTSLPVAVIPKPEPVADLLQIAGDDAGLGHALGGELIHGLAAGAGQAVLIGATCLGAAALAVVVTRGVVATTEALARGLECLDEELSRREECHAEARRAAQLWQDAAAQAVDVNARIAAFRATVRREFGDEGLDPDLPQPPPLEIGGRSLQEVYDECTRRRVEVERGWAILDRKIAEAVDKRLAQSLPRMDPALLPTAQKLLERRRAAARSAKKTTAATAAREQEDTDVLRIQAEVDEQLARIGPMVSAADHARLLQTAAKALAKGSENAARPQLDMLKRLVDQLVTRARRQTEHAVAAAQMLEGIEFLGRQGELGDDDLAVVAALRSVVDDGGALDRPLRDKGAKLCVRAERLATRLHQSERIAALLTELGYEVREGFQTLDTSAGTLSATKPGWTEHHVDLIVTPDGTSGVVVRDGQAAGDDAVRQDEQRCSDWATDLGRLVERLRQEGVEPGHVQISASERVQRSGEGRTDEPADETHEPKAREREV